MIKVSAKNISVQKYICLATYINQTMEKNRVIILETLEVNSIQARWDDTVSLSDFINSKCIPFQMSFFVWELDLSLMCYVPM